MAPSKFVGLRRDNSHSRFLTSPLQPVIGIGEFLEWSQRCDGLWTGTATTNIQKSVNFLSNARHHDEAQSEVSQLVWGIAALETPAADSSVGIRQALSNRIPQICTVLPVESLRKLVSTIYDYRSRLFHGDIPLRNRISAEDDYYDDELLAKASDYGDLVMLIVTAIIVESALRGTYRVRFEEQAIFE